MGMDIGFDMKINAIRLIAGLVILMLGVWGGAYLNVLLKGEAIYEFSAYCTTLIVGACGMALAISSIE